VAPIFLLLHLYIPCTCTPVYDQPASAPTHPPVFACVYCAAVSKTALNVADLIIGGEAEVNPNAREIMVSGSVVVVVGGGVRWRVMVGWGRMVMESFGALQSVHWPPREIMLNGSVEGCGGRVLGRVG
jgi:hypothetical protein